MTEYMLKRGEVLLMTWEEIKPVAEAILGEGCGAMTLEELWKVANENSWARASDLVRCIENAALGDRMNGKIMLKRTADSMRATHLTH